MRLNLNDHSVVLKNEARVEMAGSDKRPSLLDSSGLCYKSFLLWYGKLEGVYLSVSINIF